MRGISALLVTAAVVLGVIWAYNKFSAGGVATLGRETSTAG